MFQDQCTRDSCKYLHPPKLVKEELQASSRAFSQTQTALQQLCNPLMLQQQAAMCATQVTRVSRCNFCPDLPGVRVSGSPEDQEARLSSENVDGVRAIWWGPGVASCAVHVRLQARCMSNVHCPYNN